MDALKQQPSLIYFDHDEQLLQSIAQLKNNQIQVIGPELIFGRIYDHIGFNQIGDELFRHLVLARLAFPLSKLKTCDYLRRYQNIDIHVDKIYRFLDKLEDKLKPQVENITFRHTKRMSKDVITAVFYDMTTVHFEAEDEDDLRKTGFSKVGKHSHPQIYLGLLVDIHGYPISYDIYEGKTYEGHTLIPFLDKMADQFELGKPIVVADSGLLNKQNIALLQEAGYPYILGARLKNLPKALQKRLLSEPWQDNQTRSFAYGTERLVVHYSRKRAHRDKDNRRKGLERLQKRIRSGQLSKAHINNRGYNKYLVIRGEATVDIDLAKYEQDAAWDGLKGYITNTALTEAELIKHYGQLWQIERAFRMSKTDLRIRPIYHRLENRIRAHICIVFAAYSIMKTLETALRQEKSALSLKKAGELTQNMYQIQIELPASKQQKTILLGMDEEQQELLDICQKCF